MCDDRPPRGSPTTWSSRPIPATSTRPSRGCSPAKGRTPCRPDAQPLRRRRRPPGRPHLNASSSAARRILLVDDNVDMVESLQILLESTGHEVAIATDAEGALAQAARFEPDVAV